MKKPGAYAPGNYLFAHDLPMGRFLGLKKKACRHAVEQNLLPVFPLVKNGNPQCSHMPSSTPSWPNALSHKRPSKELATISSPTLLKPKSRLHPPENIKEETRLSTKYFAASACDSNSPRIAIYRLLPHSFAKGAIACGFSIWFLDTYRMSAFSFDPILFLRRT